MTLLISVPIIYFKYLGYLLSGKTKNPSFGNNLKNLVLWVLVGHVWLLKYAFIDIINTIRIMSRHNDINKSIPPFKPHYREPAIVAKERESNEIYVSRYATMSEIVKNYKISTKKDRMPLDVLMKKILEKVHSEAKEDIKETKAKKESIGFGGLGLVFSKSSKIDSILSRNYRKALNKLLDVKNYKYENEKEVSLEISVFLALLDKVTIENVTLLKLKSISNLQRGLFEIQDADQVTMLKRMDQLEEKLDVIIDAIARNKTNLHHKASLNFDKSPHSKHE
jgi:translation elongation factor EF-1beta